MLGQPGGTSGPGGGRGRSRGCHHILSPLQPQSLTQVSLVLHPLNSQHRSKQTHRNLHLPPWLHSSGHFCTAELWHRQPAQNWAVLCRHLPLKGDCTNYGECIGQTLLLNRAFGLKTRHYAYEYWQLGNHTTGEGLPACLVHFWKHLSGHC